MPVKKTVKKMPKLAGYYAYKKAGNKFIFAIHSKDTKRTLVKLVTLTDLNRFIKVAKSKTAKRNYKKVPITNLSLKG
jgi:hypothetical protein